MIHFGVWISRKTGVDFGGSVLETVPSHGETETNMENPIRHSEMCAYHFVSIMILLSKN